MEHCRDSWRNRTGRDDYVPALFYRNGSGEYDAWEKPDVMARRAALRANPIVRDLYVWCANASDGIITATPYWNRGKQLRDIEGKRGAPFGETVMQNATEGTIKETTYWWPRPGTDKPLEKTALYTKVGDQICSVGYYKE